MNIERKYKSRRVSYDQESRVVSMYKNNRAIKDIAAAVGLGRLTVRNILNAHEIKRPYKPAEAKKKKEEPQKGTIIKQCARGANERHKRLTELFKPTMTA